MLTIPEAPGQAAAPVVIPVAALVAAFVVLLKGVLPIFHLRFYGRVVWCALFVVSCIGTQMLVFAVFRIRS